MSEKDRIWRKGDPKWTYTEGEIVPRYMWSQVNLFEITELLNAAEKYKAIATLERHLKKRQLKKNIARADKLKEQLAAQTARADAEMESNHRLISRNLELESKLAAETERADAAMKFVRHDCDCIYYKCIPYHGNCSCGLDKFRREQKP